MVMPRSCSRSMVSRNWAPVSRSLMEPVYDSNLSARVDLPWSMWAMMLKLRMWLVSVIPCTKIGYRLSQPVLQPDGGAPLQHVRGAAPGQDAAALLPRFGGPVDFPGGRAGEITAGRKQVIHRGFTAGADVERPGVLRLQRRQVGASGVSDEHATAGQFPPPARHRPLTAQ